MGGSCCYPQQGLLVVYLILACVGRASCCDLRVHPAAAQVAALEKMSRELGGLGATHAIKIKNNFNDEIVICSNCN